MIKEFNMKLTYKLSNTYTDAIMEVNYDNASSYTIGRPMDGMLWKLLLLQISSEPDYP